MAPTPSQPRDSGQTRSPNRFHGLSLTWFGTDRERANSQGCQQEPLVKASATVPEPGNFRDRAVARAPRLCNLAAVEGKSGAQNGGLWLMYCTYLPLFRLPSYIILQTTSSQCLACSRLNLAHLFQVRESWRPLIRLSIVSRTPSKATRSWTRCVGEVAVWQNAPAPMPAEVTTLDSTRYTTMRSAECRILKCQRYSYPGLAN